MTNVDARWHDSSALRIALAISLALHAALLMLRFAPPAQFDRLFGDAPLEVILVNARSNEEDKPDQPRAIAQATLAGGGDAQQPQRRATSPLPPSLHSRTGDAAEDAPAAQRRESETALEQAQQQTLLVAQIRQQLAQLPEPDMAADDDQAQHDQPERRRQLVKLLAEIERRVDDDSARPRRRHVGPATREAAYAVYYDALKRRIEEKGTVDFPELAGKKLYGELTMVITIDHDGQVLGTRIAESSGNAALDRRAEAIARAAGPFGAFDAAMRAQADQLLVESRFRFARDATLSAQPLGR